jgi:hypothetical protein
MVRYSDVIDAVTFSSAAAVLGLGPQVESDPALISMLVAGLVSLGIGLHQILAPQAR